MADLEVDPSQVHSIEVDPSQVSATPANSGGVMSQLGDFVSHTAAGLNPVTILKGAKDLAYNAVVHPLDTANAMFNSGPVQQKIIDSVKAGNYTEAARHLAGLIPVVGPQIDKMGDDAQAGNIGAALGDATAFAGTAVAPELLKIPAVKAAVSKLNVPVIPKVVNPNAADVAATAFGRANDIPVSAATSTGNKFVAGVQTVADHSPIGSVVAQGAKAKEAAALTTVGNNLADQVYPQAVAPTQAGRDVADAITSKIEDFHADANAAYGKIRTMEADPANVQTIQTGTKQQPVLNVQGNPIPGQFQTVPVTQDIALPVDLRQAKQMLKPVYDQMTRQLPVTQQRASAGIKAMENILNGPDFAPLSQTDTDLGAIKGIARGADLPELKNASQGLAAFAVKKLDSAVQDAAAKAGPDAVQALAAGREATRLKYDAADVLKSLPRAGEEGRGVFDQSIWAKDAGIEKLRSVAQLVPSEIPKLGRAYLDDMLSTATAEGGFGRTASLYSKWQNLGPETRALLFQQPGLVKDLDNFFHLAKRSAEHPNPSGSAVVGSMIAGLGYTFANPATGVPMLIGAGALSKLLHSSAGVEALSNGLKIPIGKGAAATAAAARILKLAGQAAEPMALPQAAQSNDPSRQTAPLQLAQLPQ